MVNIDFSETDVNVTSLTLVFTKTDINQLTLTSVYGKNRRCIILFIIFFALLASHSSPSRFWQPRTLCHSHSHSHGTEITVTHSLTLAHSRLGLSVTLAHSLGAILTLALMVCFSLEALWIVCIFLLLQCRINFLVFFSLWLWLCWLLNLISSRWSWLNNVITTTIIINGTTITNTNGD